jgi:DNA-binding NarL/FixJ family response regulator
MGKNEIKILLVEDNPADVLFLREALQQDLLTSFVLTATERLSTAAPLFEKNIFDIILLDLGLPDSQGLETFTRIHQIAPEIPIIILSGLRDEFFATQAVQAGAQDYLMKDANSFSSCARAIRYAIERSKSQREYGKAKRAFLLPSSPT